MTQIHPMQIHFVAVLVWVCNFSIELVQFWTPLNKSVKKNQSNKILIFLSSNLIGRIHSSKWTNMCLKFDIQLLMYSIRHMSYS